VGTEPLSAAKGLCLRAIWEHVLRETTNHRLGGEEETLCLEDQDRVEDQDQTSPMSEDSHKDDLIMALGHLERLDNLIGALSVQVEEVRRELRGDVLHLQDTVAESAKMVQTLVDFLGVIVPNWRNRTEIEQGDDMGILIPSADAIGLIVEIVPLQLEPGFEHEEVVSMEPPAGTLVARGSTVRVRMNFTG
jgi:hypothetical protein